MPSKNFFILSDSRCAKNVFQKWRRSCSELFVTVRQHHHPSDVFTTRRGEILDRKYGHKAIRTQTLGFSDIKRRGVKDPPCDDDCYYYKVRFAVLPYLSICLSVCLSVCLSIYQWGGGDFWTGRISIWVPQLSFVWKDGSQNHSHCWKGLKYAEDAGKLKNLQDMEDFSEEQSSV